MRHDVSVLNCGHGESGSVTSCRGRFLVGARDCALPVRRRTSWQAIADVARALEQLSRSESGAAFRSPAKAAYRFFSNARIGEDKILAGQFLCTKERFAAAREDRC
jgi:hypothetical protein